MVVAAPVRWEGGTHPLRTCLADLFLTRWATARPLGPSRRPDRMEGVELSQALRDRLVRALMTVAIGDPWLERLAPFRPQLEYRLGIEAETLRVRLSFTAKELVFLTPSARALGLKVGFETVAVEMQAIARESLGILPS